MNQSTLSQGEPWMTPEERHLNQQFIQSTTQLLATRGVPESPLILLRINDVIVTWLLSRRLESALTPAPGESAPCPTIAQAGAIGKCRDRLRRAIKELEACCPRDAAPIGIALPQYRQQSEQQPTAPAPPQAEKTNRPAPPASENETKAMTTIQIPIQPQTIAEDPSQNAETFKCAPTSPSPHSETVNDTNTATPTLLQPQTPPPRRQKNTKKHRKKRGRPIRR